MKFTRIQAKMLTEAQQYCDDNEKSTEYMLEYMQDFAKVSLEVVIDFLQITSLTLKK